MTREFTRKPVSGALMLTLDFAVFCLSILLFINSSIRPSFWTWLDIFYGYLRMGLRLFSSAIPRRVRILGANGMKIFQN